jgi:hypothetical protein
VQLLSVVLATVAVAFGAASSSTGTAVTGTVLLDPATPVCRAGRTCTKPLPHFELAFHRGGVVVHATTNSLGRYRVTLRPGTYWVTHRPNAGSLTPKRVSIPAAPIVMRNFRYDAGIR